MTPGEKNIVKSLVAVAWADGKVERPEEDVIDGLLAGFDASAEEEKEIREYAKEKRLLDKDLPLAELNDEERELLLANAALLTHVDGEQSDSEKELLEKIIGMLKIERDVADEILDSVKDGALRLGSNVLEDLK